MTPKKLDDREQAINIVLSRYNVKAEKRGLKLKLSRDEFSKLITSNCYYCDQIPNTPVNYKGNTLLFRNGIDRLDSNKDYTAENCVPCCPSCNYAKRDLTVEQFLQWIKRIYISQYRQATDLTPGQLIDLLFTTDYKCWWAQEDIYKYKDIDPEKSAEAAYRAQELNAKRTNLIRTIDKVLDFSENTNTEKTYSDLNEKKNYTYFKKEK